MVQLLKEGSILVILASIFNTKQVQSRSSAEAEQKQSRSRAGVFNAKESRSLTILSISQSSSDSLSLVSSITRSKNWSIGPLNSIALAIVLAQESHRVELSFGSVLPRESARNWWYSWGDAWILTATLWSLPSGPNFLQLSISLIVCCVSESILSGSITERKASAARLIIWPWQRTRWWTGSYLLISPEVITPR